MGRYRAFHQYDFHCPHLAGPISAPLPRHRLYLKGSPLSLMQSFFGLLTAAQGPAFLMAATCPLRSWGLRLSNSLLGKTFWKNLESYFLSLDSEGSPLCPFSGLHAISVLSQDSLPVGVPPRQFHLLRPRTSKPPALALAATPTSSTDWKTGREKIRLWGSQRNII